MAWPAVGLNLRTCTAWRLLHLVPWLGVLLPPMTQVCLLLLKKKEGLTLFIAGRCTGLDYLLKGLPAAMKKPFYFMPAAITQQALPRGPHLTVGVKTLLSIRRGRRPCSRSGWLSIRFIRL